MSEAHPGNVQCAAYLLVSVWPRLEFASSTVLQVLAAPIALQFGGISAPGTNDRLAELVSALWDRRLESAPFRFGSPQMLGRDLKEARSSPTAEEKLRAVLRAVVRSLGVRLRQTTRAWLDSEPSGDGKPSESNTTANKR